MSDEESFVILGSSPTTSMDCNSFLSEPYSTIIKSTTNKNNSLVTKIDIKSEEELKQSLLNLNVAGNPFTTENIKSIDLGDIKNSGTCSTDCSNLNVNVVTLKNNDEKHTSQFQLGIIEPNNSSMKSSIYSYLPSLSSGRIDASDVEKIQYIVSEHIQLKENLEKTNVAMRQHFSMIQLFQNTFKSHTQTLNEKLKEQENINGELRKENDDLKQNIIELNKDLETNKELCLTNIDFLKKDSEELVKQLSEKESIVKNLTSELFKNEKLLSDYEFVNASSQSALIEKTTNDDKANNDLLDKYIFDNSLLLAENMEIKNMQNVYIEEIECLKVNNTAAEELNIKLHADINKLKLTKTDYERTITLLNKTINTKTEEMNLLQTQLEVYCHDFKMEREAREELAGQKEQLLTELKLLQKRNQDLMKSQNRSPELQNITISNNYQQNTPIRTAESNASSSRTPFRQADDQVYTSHQFTCPLCSKTFRQLSTLQNHVQDCLDEATPKKKDPSFDYLMTNFD